MDKILIDAPIPPLSIQPILPSITRRKPNQGDEIVFFNENSNKLKPAAGPEEYESDSDSGGSLHMEIPNTSEKLAVLSKYRDVLLSCENGKCNWRSGSDKHYDSDSDSGGSLHMDESNTSKQHEPTTGENYRSTLLDWGISEFRLLSAKQYDEMFAERNELEARTTKHIEASKAQTGEVCDYLQTIRKLRKERVEELRKEGKNMQAMWLATPMKGLWESKYF
jgi:hypothetical protein